MELRWALSARRDLLEAADFYEQFAPEVAERLLDKIENAPLALLDHPKLGAPCGRGRYRKWTVRGTPFLLIYRVLPDAVEIARVRHGASGWRGAR